MQPTTYHINQRYRLGKGGGSQYQNLPGGGSYTPESYEGRENIVKTSKNSAEAAANDPGNGWRFDANDIMEDPPLIPGPEVNKKKFHNTYSEFELLVPPDKQNSKWHFFRPSFCTIEFNSELKKEMNVDQKAFPDCNGRSSWIVYRSCRYEGKTNNEDELPLGMLLDLENRQYFRHKDPSSLEPNTWKYYSFPRRHPNFPGRVWILIH